ncbi:MAG: hypothetical protein E7222_09625 [Clostridiales bacterium]|nr:hypothetical protein [Clostridiales bacterium]
METRYKIYNCNESLLEQQQQKLTNLIVNESNPDYFKVFDMEAGCGKTLSAEQSIAFLVNNSEKNVLFVRSTNKDCQESADRINSICGYNACLVFNNEVLNEMERNEIIKKLPSYRVVCITHNKYLALSKASSNPFKKNRHVLIIDEFPADIDIIKLSLKDMEIYAEYFHKYAILSLEYENIIQVIKNSLLTQLENNALRTCIFEARRGLKNDVKSFKKLIKSNVNQEDINRVYKNHPEMNRDKEKVLSYSVNELLTWFDNYLEFFNRVCIRSQDTIYSTNKKYKRWFLDTNIILDASGSLQSAYRLDPDTYHLENLKPVLNHQKWNLVNIVCNSTSSGKERIENFYEKVNEFIKELPDCLLIAKQKEMPFFQCEHKAYFGNITGSNNYRELKNVVIAHTPNLSDVNYILRYLHYRHDELGIKLNGKSLGSGLSRHWELDSKQFETLRIEWIANEVYQAIKRVNRNMEADTKCYIFCNYTDAIELIVNKLQNCNVSVIDDFDFILVQSRLEEYNNGLKADSHEQKFIIILAELQAGLHSELIAKDKKGNIIPNTYKKTTIREHMGIKSSSNFSNKVLNRDAVKKYCIANHIEINRNYIVIAS